MLTFGAHIIQNFRDIQTGKASRPQTNEDLAINLVQAVHSDAYLGGLVRSGNPKDLKEYMYLNPEERREFETIRDTRGLSAAKEQFRRGATPADIHYEAATYKELFWRYFPALKHILPPVQQRYIENNGATVNAHLDKFYSHTNYFVDEIRPLGNG